jgi:hypothetical protein
MSWALLMRCLGSEKLYILIFLRNYFIMHDINIFFLDQNNQTIHGGQKISKRDKLPKTLSKITIF